MNTTINRLELQAQVALYKLSINPYPGRGIIVGLDETGQNLVQVYWIMGRSENSRNRVFSFDTDGRLYTEAADPSKVKDPSLIIYDAMLETCHQGVMYTVVSNGKQTNDVVSGYEENQSMYFSLQGHTYEPDAPNFTPRITASCYWRNDMPNLKMVMLRKSSFDDACDRFLYEFGSVSPGFGHCITTYMDDGNPLPAFQGEPYLLPLPGDIEMVKNMFWIKLDPDNRVSLAVKFIPRSGLSSITVINQYSKA